MITKKKHFLLIILIIGILFFNSIPVVSFAQNEYHDSEYESIYKYAEYVNGQNREEYISLFDYATQEWMESFKEENFFLGEKVTIKRIKLLSDDVGRKAANISCDEYPGKKIKVYYVEAYCDTTDVTAANIKPLNGDILYVFVFVHEDDEWKIGRVSIADASKVRAGKEGFNDSIESQVVKSNKRAMEKLLLTEPQTICVKMTTSHNKNYWCRDYVTMNFFEYIRNVVPNEYKVSYGGEYLKAGVMAVKMYSWYYTIYKKYPHSPGGCDVQDTGATEQNYVAGSYYSVLKRDVDKKKLNEAITATDHIALVDSSKVIFLTEYNAGETNKNRGSLGAVTAKRLSDSGKSYDAILIDAYSGSSNANYRSVRVGRY